MGHFAPLTKNDFHFLIGGNEMNDVLLWSLGMLVGVCGGMIGYLWKVKVNEKFCNLRHKELNMRLDMVITEIRNDVRDLKEQQNHIVNLIMDLKGVLGCGRINKGK